MKTNTATFGKASQRLALMFRALAHRNYRLYACGQLISLVGTWMQFVAQSWLVYRLTDSAALLGLVGFASQIPVFLLAPIGGAFADNHNRHRILIIVQSIAMLLAAALALLTLTGMVQVWHVFVLASLLGIVNAFDIPTRQSFLIELVGKQDLFNAISLNSSMVNAARLIGPALAGIIVAVAGEGLVFLINTLTYIAVITCLLLMQLPAVVRANGSNSTLAGVFHGFQYAWQTRPVRGLLMLLALVSLVGMPYTVLMPIFADRVLGGGPGALGMLLGASGFGALIGALSLAARSGIYGLGRWVAWASGGFGLGLVLFSFSSHFGLSMAIMVVTGFAMMIEMSASNTLIQTMVPDALRGRVMAVYSMMFMGMAPFGALLAGTLADQVGAPLTVRLGGGICVAGALLFALALPALRREGRQIIVALQMTGGGPANEMTGGKGVLTHAEGGIESARRVDHRTE